MSSKNIYTSEKILPYVYLCTHKETGQFYIGSRTSSKLNLPSDKDILKYKTSSKKVRPIFHEFNTIILAEFFDAIDAYEFEQKLIRENFENPLILNMSVQSVEGKLKLHGNAGKTQKSRDIARKRMLSDENPGKHQSKNSKIKCGMTLLALMADMTPDDRSLKYGSHGKNNPMHSKSYLDFMTSEQITVMKSKLKNTWLEKDSVWMHNFLNVNARVNTSNINEAIEQGYTLGYAENTHPNYNRSVVSYEILCPDGNILRVDNLSKFKRENNISGKGIRAGYKILSKIRNS